MARSIELGTDAHWEIRATRPSAPRRWLTGTWRFCRRTPLGAGGAVIVVEPLLAAAFAGLIAPYSFDAQIPGAQLKPPGARFLFGTDNVSRDIFSRIIYGARVSVTVGFSTVFLAALLASAVGITSGYFRGRYAIVVQRIVDAGQAFTYLYTIPHR